MGKISETTVEQMTNGGLSFGDFDEEEIDSAIESVREQCARAESKGGSEKDVDWDELEKAFLLFRNSSNDAFEGDPYQSQFFNVTLSYLVREAVPGYDPESDPYGKGAIDYDRSYSGLNLLIEELDGTFAVYMKDYSMGHIRALGECVYGYEPVDVPDELSEHWSEIQVRRRILPYLQALFISGEIDIASEIYDYYHDIPDVGTRLIEHRLNDLTTVQEAAEMLGVSASRVKKMVSDKVLDGFRREGRVWLSKAAVQDRIDYIAEHGKPTRGKSKKSEN